MERDAEWVLPEEFEQRIDAERIDAAHMEWERHERVRRVLLGSAERASELARMIAGAQFGDERLVLLVGEIEGLTEVLRGEWMVSPRSMRAVRAPKENDT